MDDDYKGQIILGYLDLIHQGIKSQLKNVLTWSILYSKKGNKPGEPGRA